MKKLALLAMMCTGIAKAQTWTYDFGTGTGTYNTASGASTTFLPTPSTNGGTARVRIGTGTGSFNLESPGTTLGSGTELRGVAPTNTSVNKFSIYDYTAAKVFSTTFNIRLDGGASGTWYFFQGDGAQYSDGSGFSGSQTFAGLRFTFGASNAITVANRASATWADLSTQSFVQAANYKVEIFGNNSTTIANYTKGTAQTVAANTYDLWVNGTLIGNDLAKAAITSDVNVDSFMFYGESSTGNVANIYLDDLSYSNTIDGTLPVSLTSFTGKSSTYGAELNWSTASEQNNSHFEILRSTDGKMFDKISQVTGSNNSSAAKTYSYTDKTADAGINYYQLKQVDFDGQFKIYGPIAVKSGLEIAEGLKVYASSGSVEVSLSSSSPKGAVIGLYDLNGHQLSKADVTLSKGLNTFSLPANISQGVYFISVKGNELSLNYKFIKQ